MFIEFDHKLPSMNIGGLKKNGTYNNYELLMPGVLTTKDPRLGLFMHLLHNIILDDRRLVLIDGRILGCSLNWIRDHVHEMKSFRHWERDMLSFLQFIIDTQRNDGQFFELIKQMDDAHWKLVDESCRRLYPDDHQSLVRLELEADVEYLVVEGAWYYYKLSEDKDWLRAVLPKLEKAIDYMTSDKKRWDSERGLVKRPHTIDTWDFTEKRTSDGGHTRGIDDDTPMSIMHGDNTGVYQAMNHLAFFNRKLGDEAKALKWEERAQKLKENIFRHLYNGTFFIHQLPLNHDGLDDLESKRLSLSNAYALNRNILDLAQSRKLIEEYIRRREETNAFAEWFTIDPPYEQFSKYKPGQYVNGAISPFTAGELARGAFNAGYEEYGWNILHRFMEMAERDGSIYFLYTPENCTPQDNQGPSAWGAASLLCAIDEGLAGIIDAEGGYRVIDFSPRFPVTDYTELRYITGYEATGKLVDVRFVIKENGMRYDIYSPAEEIRAHIYLPAGRSAKAVYVNGHVHPFTLTHIASSLYADLSVQADGPVSIEILF